MSHREIIDQAKGMLMLIYRLSADDAFAVLVWRSQELNIKLSTLAEKLVTERPPTQCPPRDACTHRPLPADPHTTKGRRRLLMVRAAWRRSHTRRGRQADLESGNREIPLGSQRYGHLHLLPDRGTQT